MNANLLNDNRELTHAQWIIGVDEVGRGCLAGPVTAACVALRFDTVDFISRDAVLSTVDDSKRVSRRDRSTIAEHISSLSHSGFRHAVAMASVPEIDKLNILGATRLAMQRCISSLLSASSSEIVLPPHTDTAQTDLFSAPEPNPPNARLLVDGRPLKPFAWAHQAITGGDAQSFTIAAASILAKVARDTFMAGESTAFPEYKFETNAGYGTRAHRDAILKYGPCPLHRLLFLRNIQAEAHNLKATETGQEGVESVVTNPLAIA